VTKSTTPPPHASDQQFNPPRDRGGEGSLPAPREHPPRTNNGALYSRPLFFLHPLTCRYYCVLIAQLRNKPKRIQRSPPTRPQLDICKRTRQANLRPEILVPFVRPPPAHPGSNPSESKHRPWQKVDGYSRVAPIVPFRHLCYNLNVYLFLAPRSSPTKNHPGSGTRADACIPYKNLTVYCCRPHTSYTVDAARYVQTPTSTRKITRQHLHQGGTKMSQLHIRKLGPRFHTSLYPPSPSRLLSKRSPTLRTRHPQCAAAP